jgi:hypothetical protein
LFDSQQEQKMISSIVVRNCGHVCVYEYNPKNKEIDYSTIGKDKIMIRMSPTFGCHKCGKYPGGCISCIKRKEG